MQWWCNFSKALMTCGMSCQHHLLPINKLFTLEFGVHTWPESKLLSSISLLPLSLRWELRTKERENSSPTISLLTYRTKLEPRNMRNHTLRHILFFVFNFIFFLYCFVIYTSWWRGLKLYLRNQCISSFILSSFSYSACSIRLISLRAMECIFNTRES